MLAARVPAQPNRIKRAIEATQVYTEGEQLIWVAIRARLLRSICLIDCADLCP